MHINGKKCLFSTLARFQENGRKTSLPSTAQELKQSPGLQNPHSEKEMAPFSIWIQ